VYNEWFGFWEIVSSLCKRLVIIGDCWNRRRLHLSGSGLIVTISVYNRIEGGGIGYDYSRISLGICMFFGHLGDLGV
jgi:hypothetical protein